MNKQELINIVNESREHIYNTICDFIKENEPLYLETVISDCCGNSYYIKKIYVENDICKYSYTYRESNTEMVADIRMLSIEELIEILNYIE